MTTLDQTDSQEPCRKVFVVSTLPWRSNELGQVMHRLDKKVMRRRREKSTNMTVQSRREGVVSSRPAHDDAPAFALAKLSAFQSSLFKPRAA